MAQKDKKNTQDPWDIPLSDPTFPEKAFASAVRKQNAEEEIPFAKRIWQETWLSLTSAVDASLVQESCAVRNVLFTREVAQALVTDEGDLDTHLLSSLLREGKEAIYPLGPEWHYDGVRRSRVFRMLSLLSRDKKIQQDLLRIRQPAANPQADQVIRDTLDLPAQQSITDAEARRAVLAAWLCFLRQNVGSCFATAPAIIVHDEQPHLFFADLHDLLATGFLKRTFGGNEYTFPLSYSWGAGDLRKPLLATPPPPLWRSPALLEALTAVEVFSEEMAEEEKQKQLEEWVLAFINKSTANQRFPIIRVEDVLCDSLLRHLEITEKNLEEYAQRPQPMMLSREIVQVPKGRIGGTASRVERYHALYSLASNIFKRFADNALLKSWEFTLASFAETKARFTSWNLYSSLGFGHEDKGGIGQCLYKIITEKIAIVKREVEDIQGEYERAYTQLKYLESRIKRASTEQEAKWIRVEYQSRANEFHSLEEMRDRRHQKAQTLANAFAFLVDKYYELFPEFFQEVYDADLHDVGVGPYDDSPAGFRLLCKHGRAYSAQWTRIHNHHEFIQGLVSFFTTTESQIISLPECASIQREVQEMITAIIQHVQTDAFLESALFRMAAVHKTPIQKNPLENIDKVEIKPWAYNSGGTMGTLVSGYYRREEQPTEKARWVEKDTELLVFLIDLFKQMPPDLVKTIEENREKSLLMHSPTHAFLLKPGWSPFYDLWHDEAYTYTWVRDRHIIPAQRMIEDIVLDKEQMHFFLSLWVKKIPQELHAHFLEVTKPLYSTMTPIEFRRHIVRSLEREPQLTWLLQGFLSTDEIDGILYESLPLFPSGQLENRLQTLIQTLDTIPSAWRERGEHVLKTLPLAGQSARLMTAKELQEVAQSFFALFLERAYLPMDLPKLITNAARKNRFALPAPITVADSNWMKDLFAFIVNPGTGEQEWWRVDYTGRSGSPMSMWRQWLDGSRPDRKWGVYTLPYEYSI